MLGSTKVTYNCLRGCGCCNFCRSGKPHFCSMENDSTIGIWATFIVAPVNRIHKVPENVSLQQVILAKHLSHLVNGWDIAGPITISMNILITGAGILGTLWACMLHHQGYRNVTISDDNQKKLNVLRKMNTGFSLITWDKLKENQKTTPNNYFDLVIESSGDPSVMELALSLLQKGGKLCCCQMASPNVECCMHPFEVFMRELSIFGVHENCFSFQMAIKLIGAMENRYLNYDSLKIKIFPLKQYQEAVEAIKRGTVSKVVFSLD
ncbi:unnamed protein product [Acanthoscelides obtectus]|uniref:Alcohol dehydrogenase-like C-terminal domain-containing protein n=1 Tax=Acanthoscelides obtectus TaxID=200917 RepID=A0A9P0JXD4_ACAOB|nr:unnamed protein product [Acanthoscelides obtectus]CAK1663785.1 L-threonine 3-dehydrogenase [Acanthoscelides obtectus]